MLTRTKMHNAIDSACYKFIKPSLRLGDCQGIPVARIRVIMMN